LEWNASNSFCHTCQFSGGKCGYNQTTTAFTCYCKDQPQQFSCQQSPTDAQSPTNDQSSSMSSCLLLCFFSADVTLGVNRKTDNLYLDSALSRTQDMSSSKLGNGRSRIFANRKLTCYQSRKPRRGWDIIAYNHPGIGANHHSFGLSNEPGQPLGIIRSSMILKKTSSLTYYFLCNKEARTLSNSQRLGNMEINKKIYICRPIRCHYNFLFIILLSL
jgi:hypothetical protein